MAIFLGLLLFSQFHLEFIGRCVASVAEKASMDCCRLCLLLIINAPDVWLGLAGIGFLYGAYLWFGLRKSADISRGNVYARFFPISFL